MEKEPKKPSSKWFLRCFSLYDVLILCIFENIQASRCVGKNSRVLVCHCRRADDRAPGACHCFQLQLLLSQGDRPGRDAVTKFQPCPELSIHAWSLRWESKNPKIRVSQNLQRVAKCEPLALVHWSFLKHQSNKYFMWTGNSKSLIRKSFVLLLLLQFFPMHLLQFSLCFTKLFLWRHKQRRKSFFFPYFYRIFQSKNNWKI